MAGIGRGIGGAVRALAAAALLAGWAFAPMARAQAPEPEVRIGIDGAEAARGLLTHLAPRFRLKTRIRLTLAGPEAVDLTVAAPAGAPPSAPPLFRRGEARFVAVLSASGERAEWARKFLDWLASPPGAHAIESYAPEDGVAFAPDQGVAVIETAAVAQASPEQVRQGEAIVVERCSRCHVIGERNKYGGLGNTPSFPALRGRDKWRARFEAFWTQRPHPSFTQIKGVTPPFDPRFPPPATPLVMTVDEVEAMLAYVATIAPKDLGAPLSID